MSNMSMLWNSEIFAAIKWESPLPWEVNKSKDTNSGSGTGKGTSAESEAIPIDKTGPHSLRKVSTIRDPATLSASMASDRSAALKSSSLSHALAPSADEMAGDVVIGSTTNRYTPHSKAKRTGYFIDSSLGGAPSSSTSGAASGLSKDSSRHTQSQHHAGGTGTTGDRSHITNMQEVTQLPHDLSLQQQSGGRGASMHSPPRDSQSSSRRTSVGCATACHILHDGMKCAYTGVIQRLHDLKYVCISRDRFLQIRLRRHLPLRHRPSPPCSERSPLQWGD